jgi:hypothetical protein
MLLTLLRWVGEEKVIENSVLLLFQKTASQLLLDLAS